MSFHFGLAGSSQFDENDDCLVISEPEKNVCFRLYILLRLIKELIRLSNSLNNSSVVCMLSRCLSFGNCRAVHVFGFENI